MWYSGRPYLRASVSALVAGILLSCSHQSPARVILKKDSAAYTSRPTNLNLASTAVASGQSITVGAGENLYSIARRQKVSVYDLVAVNNLYPPYVIFTGMKLKLPAKGPQTTQHASAKAAPIATVQPSPAPLEKPEANVTLEKASYHLPSTTATPREKPEIPLENRENSVQEGTASSFIPAPAYRPTDEEERNSEVATPTSKPIKQQQASIPSRHNSSKPLPSLKEEESTQEEEDSAESNSQPESTITNPGKKVALIWPLETKGKIISKFGPKNGGRYNDGINISAPIGTPVRAVAEGIVVYAGNELHGYGNLVIIRHPNGFLTAYAHKEDMLVKRGDRVKQGQIIGHVGNTGNVESPQLHFGLRKDSKAVNPELYLAKG